MERAVHHYEPALGIVSSQLGRFDNESRFDDAHAHIEQAKSHTVHSVYYLGRATELHTKIWYKQRRLEEGMSEALRAADAFEKLGPVKEKDATRYRDSLGTTKRGTEQYGCLWSVEPQL